MCGFIAVLDRTHPVDPERLRAALALLSHRGPDGSRTEVETLAGGEGRPVNVGLGHARLSIIDQDARSSQPLTRRGRSLVYNGELYDHRAIAGALRSRGEVFSTAGDAEVLLALLARDGAGALAGLAGMWAYAMLDRDRRTLTLGRDAYGKKPLFYRLTPERLTIASEIAPLLRFDGVGPRLNDAKRAAFLRSGWLFPDPSGSTHLDGIRELPPGASAQFDIDAWRLHVGPPAPLPPSAPDQPVAGGLKDRFLRAVERRLVSDRKVGLLLSGGVDSSLILAALARLGRLDEVACYIGDAGKSDDAAYAVACAEATGARRRRVVMDYGDAGFDAFLATCLRQEKPFPLIGNVLGAPALYAAMAEDDVRVALDGAGADEIFGGYWYRYAGFALRDALRAGDEAMAEALLAGGQLDPALRDWMRRQDDALPLPRLEALPAADARHLRPDSALAVRDAPPGDPLVGFGGALSDALLMDMRGGRMQEWLWQNDRNAMSFGVENRSPFLDPSLAREALPAGGTKFSGGWNKRALRDLFPELHDLPTARRRDKQGFRFVFARFARANHASIIELLAASRHVAETVERDAWLDGLARDPEKLLSPLAQRLLSIAGLERVGLA
jgi:asparagine synthase (glutamine-hydrolysing)